jgi:hypothetical protein
VTIDDRLRAAGRALKDSSVAQVDAASRLREIVRRTGQPVAHGPTAALLDRPPEPPEPLAPPLPPPAPPRRTPQRLALAVNLLLVLALGIVIGVAATDARDGNGSAPANASVPPTSARTAAATTIVATRTRTVPEPCLDAAELADEVISRLTRNERDNRLAEMLRDYTIASQACRREASP